MEKYRPLTSWLERQSSRRVQISFEEIEDEDRIGVKLPMSAKVYPAWWANETNPKTRHYQCRAWTDAGWQVETVNTTKELVVFTRT